MNPEVLRLKEVWERLGAEDPLWAVASLPDKRGGRWDEREFLATEVIRTLVGSIGIVAAVPLTTLVAAVAAARKGSGCLRGGMAQA